MSCANRLVLITCLIAFSIQINEATKLDRLNPALLLELFNRYETQDDAPLSSFGNSIINQDAEESLRSVSNPFRYASNRIAKDFDGFAPIDETESNELLQEPARTSNIELSFNGPSNNANPFISHGIRDQEALEHSALWRHQMMQGGAGEGQQRLKPDGSVKNVQVVKSDAMLPAYCTPPNPCPPGYTEEDGCLAHFENSAAFSRQYQSMQDCMCDTEHMFNCDSSHSNANDNAKNPNNRDDDNRISNNNRDNDEDSMGRSSFVNGRIEAPNAADEERQMDTIARSLANQPIDSEVAEHLLDTLVNHKVVAKKFMIPKQPISPFLDGEKLPIVAKKSPSNIIIE